MYFTCTSFSMHKNEKEKGGQKETSYRLVCPHVVTCRTLGKQKKLKKGIAWFKPVHSSFTAHNDMACIAKFEAEHSSS